MRVHALLYDIDDEGFTPFAQKNQNYKIRIKRYRTKTIGTKTWGRRKIGLRAPNNLRKSVKQSAYKVRFLPENGATTGSAARIIFWRLFHGTKVDVPSPRRLVGKYAPAGRVLGVSKLPSVY